MEDYRRQGGIQQLLVAEQEARQIVNTARTAKLTRLKQAKDEAAEEVAKYRAHMEKEYQKAISESTGFSGVNVKRLDEETATKIDNLKKQSAKASPEVVKMLMAQVTTVKGQYRQHHVPGSLCAICYGRQHIGGHREWHTRSHA